MEYMINKLAKLAGISTATDILIDVFGKFSHQIRMPCNNPMRYCYSAKLMLFWITILL